jgi:hypothetical protein
MFLRIVLAHSKHFLVISKCEKRAHIPVPDEPQHHDPGVEEGDGDKDDSDDDTVGEDKGVGVGEVVQHRRLGQHAPACFTL